MSLSNVHVLRTSPHPLKIAFLNRDGQCVRPTFHSEENGQRQPHNRIVQLFLSLSAYELILFVIIIICNEQYTYVDACIIFFSLRYVNNGRRKKKRLIGQWMVLHRLHVKNAIVWCHIDRTCHSRGRLFCFQILNPTNTSKGSHDVREFRVRATAACRLKEETKAPQSLNNNYYLLMN